MRSLPTVLKIVAALFIFEGLGAVVEIIVSLLHGRLSVNLGVLYIPVGLGLVRLSRGWRTCGLVFLWICLIAAPIAVLALIAGAGPAEFKFFGRNEGTIPNEAAALFIAIVFALSLWQYRVLTRPDIRSLFGLPPKS